MDGNADGKTNDEGDFVGTSKGLIEGIGVNTIAGNLLGMVVAIIEGKDKGTIVGS